MGIRDRKWPAPDKNLLWGASRGVCAYPACGAALVLHGGSKLVTVGEIAHIHAHSAGGPRYDPSLPGEYVDSYENWILLCRIHHTLVDTDAAAYPAEELREWKRTREIWFFNQFDSAAFIHVAAPPTLAQAYAERVAVQTALAAATLTGRVALTGLSGTGKSQLAIHYFRESRDQFKYQWWIRGESSKTVQSDLASLAPLVGIESATNADIGVASGAVVERLGTMADWLIVYDGVRDGSSLEGLVPSGGTVVVTSQNAGWLGYVSLPVHGLERDESLTLLRGGRLPGESDDALLSQIAELCGDNALVLAQASGYMAARVLSPGSYLALLRERRLELIAKGEGGSHETLTVSVQLILDSLSSDSLALACLLSTVSSSPLPVEEITEAPEEWRFMREVLFLEDALGGLLQYSLIERQGDEVQMHELVQHLIWASMDGSNLASALLAAEALVLQSLPQDGGSLVGRPQMERLLPHLLQLIANMEAFDEPLLAPAAFLLNRLGSYYGSRGEDEHGQELLRKALGYLSDPDQEPITRGSILHNLASIEYGRGNLGSAESLARQALEMKMAAHQPDTDLLIAYSECFLGDIRRRRGDDDEGRALHESALARFRTVTLAVRIAGCLNDLASMDLEADDLASASSRLEEAEACCNGLADGLDQQIRTQMMMAESAERRTELTLAVKHAAQAVRLLKTAVFDPLEMARVRTLHGRLLCELGELKSGSAILHRALSDLDSDSASNAIDAALVRGNIGHALCRIGDFHCGLGALTASRDALGSQLDPENRSMVAGERMLDEAAASFDKTMKASSVLLEISESHLRQG
jgi:Tetratricopeptide repeat